MSIKPYLEIKNPVDQYSLGDTSGIFLATWCLIGIHHFRNDAGGWMLGFVFLNMSAGIWNEKG